MGRFKTRVEFINNFNKIHDNKYKYDANIEIRACTILEIYCPKCNKNFTQSVASHVSGSGCQWCGKNKRYTTEEYINVVKEKHNFTNIDYSMVEYVNAHEIIKLRCIKHNHIFEITPNGHSNGRGCPICYQESRAKTNDFFLPKANEIHHEKYNYLTDYVRSHEKIQIECKDCGNVFMMTPAKHLLGQGCKLCKSSKGEIEIDHFLKSNDIIYETQKMFDECKNINRLKFDFYLTDYNMCIEFDGKQHFEIVEQWDNHDNFDKRKKRDSIKTQYCIDNNIRLLRIPYTEFKNITTILKTELGL